MSGKITFGLLTIKNYNMKNLIYLLIMFFTISFSYANDITDLKKQARELKSNKEYKKAIKLYVKAIKSCNEDNEMAELYFEVSDCYFQIGNKKMGVIVIEESIMKFGVTKNDILAHNFSTNVTNYFLIDTIKDYNGLRQKYISNLKDVDHFLENEVNFVNK